MRSKFQTVSRVFHVIALFGLATAAMVALCVTLAAAAGLIPWLVLPLTFGEITFAHAGVWVQIGLTTLLCLLLFFLPASKRVMELEQSHRSFSVTMHDVARAYHTAHSADRQGLFTMSAEFDQVRERLAFLRDHPDLGRVQAPVLEVAAQMAQQAHDLAEIYSDEKVEQARTFLRQRQAEAEEQQERILDALQVMREIETWRDTVAREEDVVANQLEKLEAQMKATLPALGYRVSRTKSAEVYGLPAE